MQLTARTVTETGPAVTMCWWFDCRAAAVLKHLVGDEWRALARAVRGGRKPGPAEREDVWPRESTSFHGRYSMRTGRVGWGCCGPFQNHYLLLHLIIEATLVLGMAIRTRPGARALDLP